MAQEMNTRHVDVSVTPRITTSTSTNSLEKKSTTPSGTTCPTSNHNIQEPYSTQLQTNGLTRDLQVVTENGDQCFMWRSTQLTYIAQGRKQIPRVLGLKFGPLASRLDLSYNTLTSYDSISMFTNLSELILDNNCLDDNSLDFKQNLRLKTLSLNKNKLTDLHRLITAVKVSFPNLEFLSLIGNPLCPTNIPHKQPLNFSSSISTTHPITTGFTSSSSRTSDIVHSARSLEFSYQRYRYFIIYHLPNLRFLDSSPIRMDERDEALRRCFWDISGPIDGHQLATSQYHLVHDEECRLTIMSDYPSNMSSSQLDQNRNRVFIGHDQDAETIQTRHQLVVKS